MIINVLGVGMTVSFSGYIVWVRVVHHYVWV